RHQPVEFDQRKFRGTDRAVTAAVPRPSRRVIRTAANSIHLHFFMLDSVGGDGYVPIDKKNHYRKKPGLVLRTPALVWLEYWIAAEYGRGSQTTYTKKRP